MLNSLYDFFASIGFKEPLHPPITHMPIGLVFGALVFFIIAIIYKKKDLELTARHSSILALVMVFPTIILGVMDWLHFYNGQMILPIKFKIALAAFVIIILILGIKFGNKVKLKTLTMTIVYVLAFLAVVGLGYFGAGIIYGRY